MEAETTIDHLMHSEVILPRKPDLECFWEITNQNNVNDKNDDDDICKPGGKAVHSVRFSHILL